MIFAIESAMDELARELGISPFELRRHNGVLTHVADAIGMSRKYLYARLNRLEIDVDSFRTSDRAA